MKAEKQYTLDTDVFVMAERVKVLEEVCDMASGALLDLTESVRLIAAQCDAALSDDRPLQAKAIYEEHERLTHIRDVAHAMSVRMGRSY